jgi:hypothetical protein
MLLLIFATVIGIMWLISLILCFVMMFVYSFEHYDKLFTIFLLLTLLMAIFRGLDITANYP